MYHQVDARRPNEKSSLCLPPALFREHLAFFAGEGYHPVGPDAFCAALTGDGWQLPDRAIMLTFDDADATRIRPAAEMLAERGFAAVFYFNAANREALPSRADLALYRRSGIVVGSHCMTHPHMSQLSDEQLRAEVVDSRSVLEDVSGSPVLHFAYPYGDHGRREVAAVSRAGYRSAVSVRKGNRHAKSDLFRLRRIPVRSSSRPDWLRKTFTLRWHLDYYLKGLIGLDRKKTPKQK
jgi:peptidoglycan/xylan/chitin deacetylase (PgdA/CDA1 family)